MKGREKYLRLISGRSRRQARRSQFVGLPQSAVMQRWEYRVVALREGHYTESLNDYGRDGWELVSVTTDERKLGAPTPGKSRSVPMPQALGRLEDAASKLSNLGADDAPAATSSLMWVLRRPLDED